MLAKIKTKLSPRAPRESLRVDKQRLHWQIITVFALALLLTLILELLNRRSAYKLILFIGEHPLMMLLNFSIMLSLLSLAQLFRRRMAVMVTISLLWLVVGVTNFIVISFRTSPFTIADVFLIKDMFSLITIYFSWIEIILIFAGVIGVIALIALLFVRAPKRASVPYLPTFIACIVLAALSFGGVKLGINGGYIKTRFTHLKDAYQSYGFIYTFIDTFTDIGIARPAEYSPDTVDVIITGMETPAPVLQKDPDPVPNIIFVQLESFFDAETLSGVTLSESPTPNFTRLLSEWPSGQLLVPVVGGGTANTEFEMLTGMSLDFFGAGEVPYYTVMRDTACESICYVLKKHGYTASAVHNYMATFYGRDKVYANLGFDVFEPMEYMDELEYGELGWASDEILIDATIEAMNATEGPDFVFTVTVSTHGKYDADALMTSADRISVLDAGETLNATQLQNYVNLASGLDAVLPDFLAALEAYPEPVICVFYGDHLPALDWDPANIESGDLFRTQYFIWNNYGADFEAPDLQAYHFSACLLKQLGIEDGVMFRYHQAQTSLKESVGYLEELKILEYDLLFGELEAFSGENPYLPTELKLGIDDIVISSAEYGYGRLLIKGDQFNEFSKILINGEALPTAYVNQYLLVAVMDELPEDIETIEVAQISNESIELSRTAPISAADIKIK